MTIDHINETKSAFPVKAGARTPTALLETKSMRQYQIQDYESGGTTCPDCGDTFSGRAGLSKHHNAQHGSKFYPLGACDRCGELYQETLGNLHASEKHYCSKSCRKAARRDQEPWNKTEHDELTCEHCGEVFEVRPCESHRKFCSHRCYTDSLRGDSPPWADGPQEQECERCGDTFRRYTEGRFCSRGCQYEWLSSRTGQDHPLWEGGVDWYRAIRSAHGPTGWHTQRKEHLADECENCGESEATLSLHHIVPVLAGGLNASWNYMTLCRTCHQRAEDYCRDLPGMEAVLTE